MTGTLKVTPAETVIRFDNGNSVHVRGNTVTVWAKGGAIAWQSTTTSALHIALSVAASLTPPEN